MLLFLNLILIFYYNNIYIIYKIFIYGGKMNPEKEIVNYWLHKNGFFTINSIKAGHNKEIGILAAKIKNGNLEKFQQIELSTSLSKSSNITLNNLSIEESVDKFIKKRFDDELIIKKIKEKMKEFGQKEDYERIIVLGAMAAINRKKTIDLLEKKGMNVIRFESILFDVVDELDKQNYNLTIRSLQLMKFMLLCKPKKLAALIEKSLLNQSTKEKFLKHLLKQEEVKRILNKEENKDMIKEVLKKTSIKPEDLAKLIAEDILTNRTRKRFLQSFLEIKEPELIEFKKKEKELSQFF